MTWLFFPFLYAPLVGGALSVTVMLIIYFIWRVDIVGIIGQSTGWFIYVRNLWFIYGKPNEEPPRTT